MVSATGYKTILPGVFYASGASRSQAFLDFFNFFLFYNFFWNFQNFLKFNFFFLLRKLPLYTSKLFFESLNFKFFVYDTPSNSFFPLKAICNTSRALATFMEVLKFWSSQPIKRYKRIFCVSSKFPESLLFFCFFSFHCFYPCSFSPLSFYSFCISKI